MFNTDILPNYEVLIMKKIVLFFLACSASLAMAEEIVTPPNESCIMSIQRSGDTYWRCYQGIFKKAQGSEEFLKVEVREWTSLEKAILAEENPVTGYQDSDRIPNETCAVGFTIESKKFLKCDGGVFQFNGKSYARVKIKDWNNEMNALFSRNEKLLVVDYQFEGCVRKEHVIECPDAVFKKDLSIMDSDMMKKLDEMKTDSEKRSPAGSRK